MESIKRKQVVILTLACLLVSMNLFCKAMPSVLAGDLVRDFALSPTMLSAFSGATMLGFGLMQIPSGVITDFLGGRNTLTVVFLIAALSVIGLTMVNSAEAAIGLRFTTGVGIAVTVPCLTVLAQWFSGASYTRANSIFLTLGSIGMLVASSPLAYASNAFGWRPVILAVGIFCLVLVVLVWRLIPSFPPDAVPRERTPISVTAILNNMRQVGRSRLFWLLAVGIACSSGMGLAFTSLWWGPYLVQGCGLSKTEAGNVLTTIFVLAIPVVPLVGWIYASILHDRRKLLMILFALSLLPMGALIWACGKNNVGLHIAVGVLFSYTVNGTLTVFYSSMRELFPLRMVGTALGCLNTVLPIGTMLVQQMIGLVLQNSQAAAAGDYTTAFRYAILVFVGCTVVGFCAIFFIRPTEVQDEDAAEAPAL